MNDRILYVDDEPGWRTFFLALGKLFVIEVAEGAQEGLDLVQRTGPYAVVVSDMHMPGMNGVQFLANVRNLAPDTVRMVLTGFADLNTALDAVNEGHIFRFLTKPCSVETLRKTLAAGIEQYRLVRAEKELLEKTLTGSVQVLTEVLGLVNPTAFGRASRIRELVTHLGRYLNAETLWQLEMAAMLSQMGCISVPEQILRRVCQGASLNAEEWELFARHPQVGHKLIAHIPRLETVAAAIACQEKRFDGVGEPADGVSGEKIPLEGRILKVALDFDNLELKGLTRIQALECMQQRVGWYDLDVLDALVKTLEADITPVLRDFSVKELLDELEPILQSPLVLQRAAVRDMLSKMILAEDVWTTNSRLVLSKGHEITIPLLERLRNYSRKETIQEPIRVWVPAKMAKGGGLSGPSNSEIG